MRVKYKMPHNIFYRRIWRVLSCYPGDVNGVKCWIVDSEFLWIRKTSHIPIEGTFFQKIHGLLK